MPELVNPPFNEATLDKIADALVGEGYIILNDFLPGDLTLALRAEFNKLRTGDLTAAGIGRQTDFQLQETVRTDKIHWISPTTTATTEFLAHMESLRAGINRRLFLGLFDYESHFAFYPVGAFYKKHLDAFRTQSTQGIANRVLSTVFYLNENWPTNAGGELVIYSETDNCLIEKITPQLGRMVIFLSEKFPHEVLPASRERKSIAGWFRVNEGVI